MVQKPKRRRKPTDTVQLKLRFPEAVRLRLVREALLHNRSLNSEIISILQESFLQSDDARGHAQAIVSKLHHELVSAINYEVIKAIRRANLKPEELKELEEYEAKGQKDK
jgi:hypothetical protein